MQRSTDRILSTHVGSLIRPAALQEFLRQRQAHHLRRPVGGDRRLTRRPGLVAQQAIHAFQHETLLPAPDAGLSDGGGS